MAWSLVPALKELREQVNFVAPNRDKDSDGIIGDYRHSQSTSSHNPDDTAQDNAEWDSDSDSRQEVRALDLDVDFRQPGITARRLVDHLRHYAKAGVFWWIRYIIYDNTMYHRRNGFAPSAYNGSNPHDKHVHINNEFSQSADTVDNVNYRLNELLPEADMAVTDVADYFDNVRQAVQQDGADGADRDWRQDFAASVRYALGYNAPDQVTENLPPAKFAEILEALEGVTEALTDVEARLAAIEERLDTEETL